MRVVTCMGGAWSLSNRAFSNLMWAISNGQEFDLDRFGKRLSDKPVVDVTDMTPEEARDQE